MTEILLFLQLHNISSCKRRSMEKEKDICNIYNNKFKNINGKLDKNLAESLIASQRRFLNSCVSVQ